MTPQDQLKAIERHFKNMNNFGWPEDVRWLIARVKALESALTDAKCFLRWPLGKCDRCNRCKALWGDT